ncbi:MAG: lipopolysaccharide transport periplasmic protein LptA [Pseudomonadota bacterium]
MRLRAVGLILACLAGGTGTALAAPQSRVGNAPIQVSADRLLVEDKQNRATYSGNVEVKQGDLTITAQKVVIQANARTVERVVATGNPVRLNQLNRRGEGRQLVYEPQRQVITLSGNAHVWQDQNEVMGERIVYYVQQQRTEVSSEGQGRVKSIFYPKQGEAAAPGGTAPSP